MRRARLIPLAVCCIPASRARRGERATFGQQNSIYYDVVGAKPISGHDMMVGQAPGNGINGDYDGSIARVNH